MILDTIPLSCALWLFFPLRHFTIHDLLFGRKRENLVMGARVGRWTRTDLVLFQHGGISRFSCNVGFPRANTRRSLAWLCGLSSPGLRASPFWMEYKKKCLTENRTLVGWINNSTTVAVVPRRRCSCLDNPWRRSLVGCSPWGCTESDTTERLHFHFSLSCIREGDGNPLRCSCLENPRDGGAWWAAVSGVAQSRTRLKRLSSSSSSSKTPNTNKRMAKPKFAKKDFIPIRVWLALWFGARGKYLRYDGDVSRGRCGVLRGVRFKCSGLEAPIEGNRCLLEVDSGRGGRDQTSQWTETISDSESLSQSSGPQPFWHQAPVSWKTIFPWNWQGEWFQDDSSSLCLLCTLFLLLLHQLHLRSSGIRSWLGGRWWGPLPGRGEVVGLQRARGRKQRKTMSNSSTLCVSRARQLTKPHAHCLMHRNL